MLLGYDSAYPLTHPPNWPVCGFYVGGNTPHTWDTAEVQAQPARYYAPLYVLWPAAGQAQVGRVVDEITTAYDAFKIPRSVTIWLDTEDWPLSSIVADIDTILARHGMCAGRYGSIDQLRSFTPPSGGYWSADWDQLRVLDPLPDCEAHQFASATMLHTGFDGSVWGDTARLWDRKPEPPAPATSWERHALDLTNIIGDTASHLENLISVHLPAGS